VVSSDISPGRVRRMLELLRAQGVRPGGVIVADAGGPAPFGVEFDAALADVPCSGLGTLRRNPEIKWNFKPEEFAALGRVQAAILRSVSQSVAVGGRLLYSTCSTEPEENERVVEDFLGAHPGFRSEEPRYPEGVAAWVGTDGCVRTFPSARRWEGFFAALLRRWN
jgi:16S rRNA (cytosine967-C5)-methyltransferase